VATTPCVIRKDKDERQKEKTVIDLKKRNIRTLSETSAVASDVLQ